MNPSTPLSAKVESFLREQSIRSGRIVVAVSGGPDSIALLRALLHLHATERLSGSEPLVVAHLNHQLRGSESDADEKFVRELVEVLEQQTHSSVVYRGARMDVAAQAAAEGRNLEEVARRRRYDWFATVAQEAGCAFVATGHTADDQAETVLHHLLRGTGLKGLRGIAPRRNLIGGIELIRPLLQVRRSEILAFLNLERQNFREDSSNLCPDFTRNRIRHDLIPYLAANYNPEIVAILARLAEQAGEAFQESEAHAQQLLSQVELPRAGECVVLELQPLATAPANLLREMFRLLWSREGWHMGNMGFQEWTRLATFAGGKDAAMDLPDGIRIRRRERVVLAGPVS